MVPAQSSRLEESGPRVGIAILFDGQEWQVTDQSSYSTDEGYRVHEWCCERGDTTGYLLKEGDPKQGSIRWFFTREIDADGVKVSDGKRLAERLQGSTDPAPPDALTHEGVTYRYADTTDGTHEDASGKRVRKVTWDYWDGGHAKNLAVERWPDGSLDCYLGAHIQLGQIAIHRAAPQGYRPRLQANPFLGAAVSLPFFYFLAFVIGWPFDEGLSLALSLAALVGWLLALPSTPVAGLAAILAASIGGAVFWRFPPLTTAPGLVTFFAAPSLIGWLARTRGHAGKRLAVQYAGTLSVAAPLFAVGLAYYFRFAPGPHTLDQLSLALGPAGLGAFAGYLVSGLVLGREE